MIIGYLVIMKTSLYIYSLKTMKVTRIGTAMSILIQNALY